MDMDTSRRLSGNTMINPIKEEDEKESVHSKQSEQTTTKSSTTMFKKVETKLSIFKRKKYIEKTPRRSSFNSDGSSDVGLYNYTV